MGVHFNHPEGCDMVQSILPSVLFGRGSMSNRLSLRNEQDATHSIDQIKRKLLIEKCPLFPCQSQRETQYRLHLLFIALRFC